MKENLFYELNITEDGYVIGRHNHDEADSVSIVGYTEESKHARLFVAAPKLLEALQNIIEECENPRAELYDLIQAINDAKPTIAKALGE